MLMTSERIIIIRSLVDHRKRLQRLFVDKMLALRPLLGIGLTLPMLEHLENRGAGYRDRE
jgi:hypothetical protein